MNRRVVITGLGVVSSIGIGWQAFWDSLLAGRSGISPVTSFDTRDHFTHNGGEVKEFRAEDYLDAGNVASTSRATQMAIVSASLALRDAGLVSEDIAIRKSGACIGTNIGSLVSVERLDELLVHGNEQNIGTDLIGQIPTHTTLASVAGMLGLNGPTMMFSTACAAGNYAIGHGFDLIRLHRADLIIAGAAEGFSKVAFTGFNQFKAVAPEECQPFDLNRKGMMVAEGAGMLILETLESAEQRKAPIYAEIGGYGLSCDAHHMTASLVDGVAVCMRKALQEAGCAPEDVDYVSAHGTGTLTNDRNECAAMKQVFGDRYNKIPTSSIKSMLGHSMGAASALEAIACALAVKHDTVPPTINHTTPDPECDIDCVPQRSRQYRVSVALNNSYAFGGNNASLVLRKFSST